MADTAGARLMELANGYIREQYATHDDYDQFETSLINVIITFLGNIFMCFDIYPSMHESKFSHYNTVFRRSKDDPNEVPMTFGCSYGMNEGIYRMQIENKISGFGSDAFGITTNIDIFRKHSGWFDVDGEADVYFLNGTLIAKLNDSDVACQMQYGLFKANETEPGDVITILYDGKQYKLTYLLNDKQLGKSVDVIHQTYYFFVSSCYGVKNVEYHVKVDHN